MKRMDAKRVDSNIKVFNTLKEEWIDLKTVAESLGKTVQSLRNWIIDGFEKNGETVQLEGAYMGDTLGTSRESLARFSQACSQMSRKRPRPDSEPTQRPSQAKRKRKSK